MNKNIIIVILIVFAFVIGILIGKFFFTSNSSVTGNVVSDKVYSWTTAVCDDKNRCIDVLIECENGEVKRISPASDLMEFKGFWEDPRVKDFKYCE